MKRALKRFIPRAVSPQLGDPAANRRGCKMRGMPVVTPRRTIGNHRTHALQTDGWTHRAAGPGGGQRAGRVVAPLARQDGTQRAIKIAARSLTGRNGRSTVERNTLQNAEQVSPLLCIQTAGIKRRRPAVTAPLRPTAALGR